MTKIKQHWLQVLTVVVLLSFAANVSSAQDADATTTPAPVQVVSNAPAQADASASGDDSSIIHRDEVVQISKDSELKADEEARDVVTVFGSTRVLGHATGDVVAVGGDVYLDGKADGNVVAVFGTVHAGSNAVVGGDAVSVGGEIEREAGAKFHGRENSIDLPFIGNMSWVSKWFTECVAKLRPLSFRVRWVWPFVGAVGLFYLLIAAAFPQAVRPCVEALNTRPMTTLAVGILGPLGILIVAVLLGVTVIGIPVIPFLLVAVFVAFIVGKVAILERIGSGMGKGVGVGAMERPVLAFILGAFIITLVYTVPILGLLTFLFIAAWGFGAATTAAFVHLRRERPPKTPIKPAAPNVGASPAFTMPVAATAMSAGAPPINYGDPVTAGAPPGAAFSPTEATGVPPLTGEILPVALTYPRAGFWMRMGAGFLDCVLIMLVSVRGGPALVFLVGVAYFAGMLAWKGTTVGGIILRLQVVRSNGQPVSFLVALVRALAAVFSGMILFLGFFWIGWDGEKRGWHDMIAGTMVVRLPYAPSLVCI